MRFFPITRGRIELETWDRHQCVGLDPDASYDMQHDMVRSIRDLDLRSRSRFDLSRSTHTSFDPSRRGEHDGAIIFVLTFKTTSY